MKNCFSILVLIIQQKERKKAVKKKINKKIYNHMYKFNQWMENIGYNNNINKGDMYDSINPLKKTLVNCTKTLKWLKIVVTSAFFQSIKWDGEEIFEMLNNKIIMQQKMRKILNLVNGCK